MSEDFIEIGESGLVPTEYGFYDTNTKEKLDFDGNKITEDTEAEPAEED